MTFSLSSGISSAITVREMFVTDSPSKNVTYNIKHIHNLTMNFISNYVMNIFIDITSHTHIS